MSVARCSDLKCAAGVQLVAVQCPVLHVSAGCFQSTLSAAAGGGMAQEDASTHLAVS